MNRLARLTVSTHEFALHLRQCGVSLLPIRIVQSLNSLATSRNEGSTVTPVRRESHVAKAPTDKVPVDGFAKCMRVHVFWRQR